MKKFLQWLFSPAIISFFLILLQLALIIVVFIYIDQYYWIAQLVLEVLAIPVAFIALNSRMDSNYKIAWLFFIVCLPLFGIVFYLLFANKKFTPREKKKIAPIADAIDLSIEEGGLESAEASLDPDKDSDCLALASYLDKSGHSKTFKNTRTSYYCWGEQAFEAMKEKLRLAEHYIFIEFFIIGQGKMWDEILEILKEKVAEGVDVRVMYDDIGSLGRVPYNYYKELRSYGIKASVFNKVKPIVNIRLNNRDHRKILVIDGYIGFTGGINLADEYINEYVRFGKWKDNVVMLEGEGVYNLTSMFLSNWLNYSKYPKEDLNFKDYLPTVYANLDDYKDEEGCVSPYGSLPYTFESVGMNVYLNIINKAKKYLYISTPYLIPNKEIENAICLAAKSGVDVRIIVPGIPDKKQTYQVTKSSYRVFLEAGVKIYEYIPGFIHAKTFLADDTMAVVGSINLDYRSLFLHMENGCFLYKCPCIQDIRNDFEHTMDYSHEVDEEEVRKTNPLLKFWRLVLKVFAPLL
ncbi:MAG: cardiolipin synthase [Coprobacillus sp.]|nr:cardiolipin synthase [Coprobacillus sp.]